MAAHVPSSQPAAEDLVLTGLRYSTLKTGFLGVLEQMHLGADGELAVGQFLEETLRPMGFQVLHVILGRDFNVDHFVVGPAGLYCIETKTHSKPERGECRITYDGVTVSVNGFKPDRDPVVQAKAEAKWVSDLIAKSTERSFLFSRW